MIAMKSTEFLQHSPLYREFLAERDEILRHKWLESEKLGHDIGFDQALLEWVRKHRDGWRAARRAQPRPCRGEGVRAGDPFQGAELPPQVRR